MRISAIPVVAFYDDFGPKIDHLVSTVVLKAFIDLAEMLGVRLKLDGGKHP